MKDATAGGNAALDHYPDAVLSATDAASGVTVTVEPNGTTLTATEAEGKVRWSVDIIAESGKPASGFPVIRNVEIAGGAVTVVVGKSAAAKVDLQTGKAGPLSED